MDFENVRAVFFSAGWDAEDPWDVRGIGSWRC
jgi:hypothetical protein